MSANDYYNKGPQQPQYGQPQQQGGYYPPPGGPPQGYAPQQQQPYAAYPQQPVYVQQPPQKKGGGGGTGCLACLAGACLWSRYAPRRLDDSPGYIHISLLPFELPSLSLHLFYSRLLELSPCDASKPPTRVSCIEAMLSTTTTFPVGAHLITTCCRDDVLEAFST
ncbi:hypothetical protein PCANC_03759 [Puccinia coronata f. sp. avenae]|uniref:Cysteine-rich transmembrane CYSTM domain-containing protein n=1 Tax=Puccinia coronata f. sp. avenae TaxID=200324 RepID=A0A2N5RV65_9BASI|nr:hypothetical protein PCANC_27028 [Puccinia coronata f. sp. avenae]PLW53943.1 hypothetical protein PCANC_03759 [Puccinia coronata f. sp. avenae]